MPSDHKLADCLLMPYSQSIPHTLTDQVLATQPTKFVFFLFIISLVTACDQSTPKQGPTSWVARNNAFSLQLLKQSINMPDNHQKNVLVSGPSITTVGSMLWLGSTGSTQHELAQTLFGSDHISTPALCQFYGTQHAPDTFIKKANALWIKTNIKVKATYQEQVKQCMHTDIHAGIDAHTINAWVDKKTDGMIKHVITPPELQNAIMVLTNALSFKGTWAHAFDPHRTQLKAFWSHNIQPNERLKPSMTRTMAIDGKKGYQYTENKRWQVLSIPFKDKHQHMVFLLPKACDTLPHPHCQLEEQLQKMDGHTLDNLVHTLKPLTNNSTIHIEIPKFTFNNKHNLIPTLKLMGIHSVFSPEDADFSPMFNKSTYGKKPYIQVFKQINHIAIDEQGAKAAAVTVATIGLSAVAYPTAPQSHVIRFVANHPFAFIVNDAQGQVLFVGRYAGPKH